MAIVKILSRHNPSFTSLANYVLRYAVQGTKANKAEIYTHNLRSDTIAGYVKEFIQNEAFRKFSRSNQIFLFHEILSFHAQQNDDVITKPIIDDLVHEYIKLRGETGVILGAVHRDKEHVHVHFCVSALEFRTGKSFGLSKAKLQELKVSFQKYHTERYPQIEQSTPQHGRSLGTISRTQWHTTQRQTIIDTVRQCFTTATSQKNFLGLLRDNGLHHYERNGKPTGIEYEGFKFRFSRLLENDSFDNLPIERSEEIKALDEIRAVRERQQFRDEVSRALDEYAR